MFPDIAEGSLDALAPLREGGDPTQELWHWLLVPRRSVYAEEDGEVSCAAGPRDGVVQEVA
eukprot:11346193-Alexandrium_andersonii.AAC.1